MTKRRRGLPAARFDEIAPDPSRIGGVAEAPFVRLPDPATLFATRAGRLRHLAEGHPMAAYLSFLATVVDAQAGAATAVPPPAPLPAADLALRMAHAMPPLSADAVRGNVDFAATLTWMLAHLVLDGAPEPARDAVRNVAARDCDALAAEIMEGAFPADRLAECLFVAAAMQVHLSRLAGQLDAHAIRPPAEGICPVCGAVPVSSVVVGWTQASKARYCACSLCGTLWNHVRIKCTSCGGTEGIAYYTIENGPQTIGIETCSTCRCYIKHLQQHEDPALDPIADDAASYALDVLASEEDFRRSGVNPFFLT